MSALNALVAAERAGWARAADISDERTAVTASGNQCTYPSKQTALTSKGSVII